MYSLVVGACARAAPALHPEMCRGEPDLQRYGWTVESSSGRRCPNWKKPNTATRVATRLVHHKSNWPESNWPESSSPKSIILKFHCPDCASLFRRNSGASLHDGHQTKASSMFKRLSKQTPTRQEAWTRHKHTVRGPQGVSRGAEVPAEVLALHPCFVQGSTDLDRCVFLRCTCRCFEELQCGQSTKL